MTDSICFEILEINPDDIEKNFIGDELNERVQQKIEKLKHGDILLLSTSSFEANMINHYNGTKFYLVSEKLINGKNGKNLCELISTSNEVLCIPLEISEKLYFENKSFLKNYLELFESKFKNYKNTFKAIELDFKTHLSLLPENVRLNNQFEKLNEFSRLYYFFDQQKTYENHCNFFIEISKADTCESNKVQLLALNFNNFEIYDDFDLNNKGFAKNESEGQSLENNYLMHQLNSQILEIEENDRDPELEEFSQKFKNVYDNDFKNYLKKLKRNEIIYATSLPTKKYCKDTYDNDSLNSTTLMFYFERLDLDENENINAVVVRTFDNSELCHFTPNLINEYGIYYKAMLFTCIYNIGRTNSSSQNFFLDLPIYLYNKIDSDD